MSPGRGFTGLVIVASLACSGRGEMRGAAQRTMLDAPPTRGISPAITIDSAGHAHYAWVALDSSGTGHLFTMGEEAAARELVDPLGPAQFDGETPPKLQTAPDGALVMSYAVQVADSTAKYQGVSGLRFVRSSDAGATWSAPVTVADDGDLQRYRNDHTMTVGRDGAVYVAWLDERAIDTVRVYLARSDDQGATWSRNVALDMEEACGCCRTPVTTGADGTVYAIWRKVLGPMRDHVVSRSRDRGATWSAPTVVHADSFAIAHCPDAGPSIAVDANNRLHVSWWTGREGAAGVKYARSDDGGVTFSAPIPLGVAPFAKASHSQLALFGASGVAVVWDDGTLKPARIALRVSRDGGTTFGPPSYLSDSAATASFPVLAVRGDRVEVLWQERGAVPGAVAPEGAAPSGRWIAYDARTPARLVRTVVPLP
ncbi:MAG: exo-alpha-sialidase [Gemmatimonadetes bacterium]|nr:exo-alpha-sialidase [Gemmatimonadota bacterium]